MHEEKAKRYRTFLLRCWREGDTSANDGSAWRFSVEEILGERRRWGFGSFEGVVALLSDQLMEKARDAINVSD